MEEKKLKDICEFIVDCPHSTAKDEGSGYPLIRTPNVGKGRLILQGVHRVNEQVYKTRNERATPSTGDIILAREAPVGNAAIIMPGQKVCLGQRVVLFRVKKEIANPMFLVYYLLSNEVQHKLKNNANGAVVAHLNMDEIRNLAITLPRIDIQNKIAAILSSIDDKIEVSRRINDNLEQQAQALFKSWFVDFEPFKNGEFIESELGRIPKGWRVGTLGEVLNLRKDSYKKGSDLTLPYMPIDIIPMHSLGVNEFKDNKEAQSSLQTFEKNDIIIGAMRVYFHRVVIAPCKGITRNTCFVLKPKNNIMWAYCILECNQDEAINYANRTSKGSTMPYAVWENGFADYSIVIPPDSVLEMFNLLVSPILEKIRDSYKESRRLAELRDTLLPKLMSGEIKVGDVTL